MKKTELINKHSESINISIFHCKFMKVAFVAVRSRHLSNVDSFLSKRNVKHETSNQNYMCVQMCSIYH